MGIKIKEANKKILLINHGELVGEITWSLADNYLMIIDHTYINDAYRGNGYGSLLVYSVVEKARREGLQIIPLCPFSKRIFLNNPEYHDVLKDSQVFL